jgi:hypothetical protein
MPPVARTLALALAPALIDVISVALFRMHLPMQDRHGRNYKLWRLFLSMADIRRHSFKCELEKSNEENVDGFCGRCGLAGRDWVCGGSRC